MKRLVFILSVLLISQFMQANAREKGTILATASMIADIASNIGGELWTVESIVPIGGDPHIYRPTPGDAKRVLKADIILMNGLTFEGWLEGLIQNSGTEAKVVTVTAGVEPLKSLTYHSPDPHAWMTAMNGIIYAENIKKTLQENDPENSDIYETNYAKYKKDLEDMDAYIFEQIERIPEEHRILITSHDAFQYYGRRYGLRLESILGISTDADVQTEDVVNLQKVIRQTKVPAVFVETTVNPKMLQEIASDNGIRIGGSLLSDSLGDLKTGGETYLKMLKQNTDVIVAALTNSQGPAPELKAGKENYLVTAIIVSFFLAAFVYMYYRMKKIGQ